MTTIASRKSPEIVLPKRSKNKKPKLAETVDRHVLYQESVQDVESEVEFIEETFRAIRGRAPRLLREDFCGTANTACEWARRHNENRAIGVDLDEEVLNWGREHNLGSMTPGAQRRVQLIHGDALTADVEPVDALLAMNFSYWLFDQRQTLLTYFKRARAALKPDGLLFLDAYGGWDAHRAIEEEREVEGEIGDFTYIWDQDEFDPISHRMKCYIHFKFEDGSKIKRAFEYTWRFWSLPELRDLLTEAGFQRIRFYWEGADDDSGEGNGEFTEVTETESDPGWICYIVAEP